MPASACAAGGNVLILSGDAHDYIHPGYERITAAKWEASPSEPRDTVGLNVVPVGAPLGSTWMVQLNSVGLSLPLAVGTYQGATEHGTGQKPGLVVDGDFRGCNTVTGTFTIVELAWDGAVLTHVLASFEQHCEGLPPALYGCVKYDAATDAGP